MINEHSTTLKRLYAKYNVLHDELRSLEQRTQELLNRQLYISQELQDTRKEEITLINKIKEEIGREITQDELVQIIKNND